MAFDGRTVLDGVSFTVEPGSVVGFLGPNGAGKTTTMRLLAGYLRPASGSALICRRDVCRQRRAAQALLGYLPEAAGGFANLTVREFLTFCGEARGIRGRALRMRIDAVCIETDLAAALDTPMGKLSKGWRQRAWFAQALLHDPPVLILDEPTDGLDPIQKSHVRALILRIAEHKAILLSTHILEEAEEVCSRAIIFVAGRIVADDTPQALGDEHGRLAATFGRLAGASPERTSAGA
jgi:ABC-2 type transport system ATP-binding protein